MPRLTYLVERDAAAVVAGNPHLERGDRGRALAGLAPHRRRSAAGAAAPARALRCGARPARRPAQLVADAGDRRAAADRLRHRRAGSGCTRAPCTRPRELRPRHSVRQPMGPAQRDRRLDRRAARSRPTIPSRCRSTRPRTGASPDGCARPASTPRHELIVVHVSAGNPFRRWPEPAFADWSRPGAGSPRRAA